MGLFPKIDHTKKVNVWLLVGLSFVPIACCYSFLVLKTFRKMFLINLAMIMLFIGALVVSLMIGSSSSLPDVLGVIENDPAQLSFYFQLVNWVLIPLVDAILVWHWSKEHNRQIDQKQLTK